MSDDIPADLAPIPGEGPSSGQETPAPFRLATNLHEAASATANDPQVTAYRPLRQLTSGQLGAILEQAGYERELSGATVNYRYPDSRETDFSLTSDETLVLDSAFVDDVQRTLTAKGKGRPTAEWFEHHLMEVTCRPGQQRVLLEIQEEYIPLFADPIYRFSAGQPFPTTFEFDPTLTDVVCRITDRKALNSSPPGSLVVERVLFAVSAWRGFFQAVADSYLPWPQTIGFDGLSGGQSARIFIRVKPAGKPVVSSTDWEFNLDDRLLRVRAPEPRRVEAERKVMELTGIKTTFRRLRNLAEMSLQSSTLLAQPLTTIEDVEYTALVCEPEGLVVFAAAVQDGSRIMLAVITETFASLGCRSSS